jgi:cell division septation protein DedD
MGKIAHREEVVATGGKKGGDMVLGGRHLVGIFVLLVVLFGVIFTLGYLLGRSQYDTQIQAAASPLPNRTDSNAVKPSAASAHSSAEAPPAEPPSDWDFYHSAEPEKPAETLPAQPKPISASPKASLKSAASPAVRPVAKPIGKAEVPVAKPFGPSPVAPKPSAKSSTSPLIPRGATVLQVAALVRQADALALAQALQKKKFPAFVLTPPADSNDHFFRVQVGPYADSPSATAARQKLEAQGFKSIVKR